MCEATERSSILVFLLFCVPILGAATSCSHETAESPQKLSSGGKAEERRGLVAKIRSCAEITTKSVVRGNTKAYLNIRTEYVLGGALLKNHMGVARIQVGAIHF